MVVSETLMTTVQLQKKYGKMSSRISRETWMASALMPAPLVGIVFGCKALVVSSTNWRAAPGSLEHLEGTIAVRIVCAIVIEITMGIDWNSSFGTGPSCEG